MLIGKTNQNNASLLIEAATGGVFKNFTKFTGKQKFFTKKRKMNFEAHSEILSRILWKKT